MSVHKRQVLVSINRGHVRRPRKTNGLEGQVTCRAVGVAVHLVGHGVFHALKRVIRNVAAGSLLLFL